MKRILIIIIILLILGAGAYYFANRTLNAPTAPIEQAATTETTPVTDPASPAGVALIEPTPIESPVTVTPITAMTSEKVVDFWINQLDGQAYYVTVDGAVKRADPVSGPEHVSSSHFDSPINRIIPSNRGDAIIIVSGEPRAPLFKILDVEKKLWRTLPEGTIAASWNPTGPAADVVFLKVSTTGGVNTLNRYGVSKAQATILMPINVTGVDLTWMSSDIVYLSGRPTADAENAVWSVSLKQKTLLPVLAPRRGLWTVWTPGVGGLAFDPENGMFIMTSSGAIETALPLATLPSKCFLERPMVYCAMSYGGLTAKTRLLDAYLQHDLSTGDDLVSFSLLSPKKYRDLAVLFDAQKAGIAIDAWHVAKRGNALYFINRYDDRLYRLELQ